MYSYNNKAFLFVALLLSSSFENVTAFGGLADMIPLAQHPSVASVALTGAANLSPVVFPQGSASNILVATAASSASVATAVAAKETSTVAQLLMAYTSLLATYPLSTKMATAAVLAVAGDAIAQTRDQDVDYDSRRAASFMVFDVSYRAVQSFLFPYLVTQLHGDLLLQLISTVSSSSIQVSANVVPYLAAMEQTLANQLVVVPLFYYPVFFAVTGAIQGLSMAASIQRAKENFWPLLKRNLLFWIPVQFVQFGFIQEDLQVPFLCACGLVWTFILSVMAGSTKGYGEDDEDESPEGVVPATAVTEKEEAKELQLR